MRFRALPYLVVATLLALFGFAGLRVLSLRAAPEPATAAQQATNWLISQQQNDGSFPGLGVGSTADAVLALVANGTDPNTVQKNGNTPLTYLAAQAPRYTTNFTSTNQLGKLVQVVAASGQNPRAFAGRDLVSQIEQSLNPTTGLYGSDPTVFGQANAILGLAAAGRTVPVSATTALSKYQFADGSWSFDGAAESVSDTNTTSIVVQALLAGGVQPSDPAITKALAYFRSQQSDDGGFPLSTVYGTNSDPSSTAYVIQALIAARQNPREFRKGDNEPVSALLTYQRADGSLESPYTPGKADPDATYQAVPALLLKAFPVQLPSVRLYLPVVAR